MLSVRDALTFELVKTVLQGVMIKTNNPKRLFLLMLLLQLAQLGHAQVYPGDANNDGVVNNLDVLYVGYAYGSVGPSRIDADSEFSEAAIPLLWEQCFGDRDSTNFAFADADGNGIINFEDFLTIHRNFGSRRLNPAPAVFQEGIPGVDPQLKFGVAESVQPITAGSLVEIPVLLESPLRDSVEDVNGLAFTIEYDSEFIQGIRIDYSESWFMRDSAAFQYQADHATNPDRYEGALTRFGRNPISGSGKMLKISAIIEDDLIGLRPGDTAHVHVGINFIKMKNGDFVDIPVVGDTTIIAIHHPDMLVPDQDIPTENQIKIYPNPASDWLRISSPVVMEHVAIYNGMGRLIRYFKQEALYDIIIHLHEHPPGVYFIKIHLESGFITQKIIVE